MTKKPVTFTLNGELTEITIDPRKTLADALREDLGLVGTKLGCEHGICGACTVIFDGDAARSCLIFAVQAEGATVETVEGLSKTSGLSAIQKAFRDHHALQCGFCTPGFLMSVVAYLRDLRHAGPPTDDEIREALSGNICRCTGYEGIVEAVKSLIRDAHDGETIT